MRTALFGNRTIEAQQVFLPGNKLNKNLFNNHKKINVTCLVILKHHVVVPALEKKSY
jgi:hypothetical protein